MGSKPCKPEEAPVVVIIGAGYAGGTTARKLEGKANVVVIERKAFGQHAMGSLRAAVVQNEEDDWRSKVFCPLTNLVNRGAVVHGEVTGVSDDAVTVLGMNSPIRFDYLVIASGSQNCLPGKAPYNVTGINEVRELYGALNKNIADAAKILIVGGGPVGVELLGDIKDAFPAKEITLVHSRQQLISNPEALGDAFRAMVTERTRDYIGGSEDTEVPKNRLILGERLDMSEDPELSEAFKSQTPVIGHRTVRTNKGTEIETDLIFWCMGLKKLTAFVEDGGGAGIPMDRSSIKVTSNLLVEGKRNIFAIGDCNSFPGNLGYNAQEQGEICATNITKLIEGKTVDQLKEFAEGSKPVMMVQIGTNDGVTKLPFKKKPFGRKVTQLIKGDLFTKKSAKEVFGRSDAMDGSQLAEFRRAGLDKIDHTQATYLISMDGVPYAAKALGMSENDALAIAQKQLATIDLSTATPDGVQAGQQHSTA